MLLKPPQPSQVACYMFLLYLIIFFQFFLQLIKPTKVKVIYHYILFNKYQLVTIFNFIFLQLIYFILKFHFKKFQFLLYFFIIIPKDLNFLFFIFPQLVCILQSLFLIFKHFSLYYLQFINLIQIFLFLTAKVFVVINIRYYKYLDFPNNQKELYNYKFLYY